VYVKRNVFTVPSDVDFNLDGPVTAAEESELDRKAEELYASIATAKTLNEALRVHKYTKGEELRKWESCTQQLDEALLVAEDTMSTERNKATVTDRAAILKCLAAHGMPAEQLAAAPEVTAMDVELPSH